MQLQTTSTQACCVISTKTTHCKLLQANIGTYIRLYVRRAGRYTNFGDGTVFYKISRYK